ncbi:helix-turn-helix transcriptional regulator [Flavobacterium maritimum]|uniref:helix-turn-helix transcriptional regulator n=1 Tax=Flavobacterium maritimum TaxID=3149042 RepID=UPI0032B3B3D5
MKTHFDIEKFIENGSITNELDLERAMIADRKLRLLSKENVHFKNLRKKLRDLIEDYENREWSNLDNITEEKVIESDKSEIIAERERIFIENRKQQIRKKLKALDLTQENLGHILGHKSKTHMSELMNGIKPFTLKDLVIINRLLKIDIKELVPIFLSREDQIKVKSAVIELNKPQIKLEKDGLMFC